MAVVIHAGPRRCVIPRADADALVRRLKHYSSATGDVAWGIAITLQKILEGDVGPNREITIEATESADVLAMLNVWRDEQAPLSDPLECLRDGLMTDAGMI